MRKDFLQAAAALLASAAILLSGCSGSVPAETVSAASAAPAVTTTNETTAAETAPDTDSGKEVNSVRTAEELKDKKVIALTFDDGPNTTVTDEILDIIEEYGITASFFVIGGNITPESAKVMQRAHTLGCEINSHSFTHSYMNEMSADDIRDEMERTSELIYQYTGEYPKFFRPPYIAVSEEMFDIIDLPFISGLGCNDWDDSVSVEKRVRFLTEKCPENCIILLHDQAANEKTVEALREALPIMLKNGFTFVTTTELFIANGITPDSSNGTVYSYASESGWQP